MGGSDMFDTDPYAFGPGYGLDACCLWLETFEPLFSTSRTICWCEVKKMVVGGQQLDGPGDSHQEGAMIMIPEPAVKTIGSFDAGIWTYNGRSQAACRYRGPKRAVLVCTQLKLRAPLPIACPIPMESRSKHERYNMTLLARIC